MNILLDTTVIVDYLRNEKTAVTYITSLSSPTISLITEAEIYEGCKNNQELQTIAGTLNKFTILFLTEEISLLAIKLLRQYHLSYGLHILDSFIAATTIVHKRKLATANLKHFQMIKELSIIPWPPKP